MASIELTWLLDVDNGDENQQDLLAAYYREVANGPMTDYRRILQSGHKQGQNYYVHVLDGIGIFHKLRTAGIVEINDLEEQILFAAYTIHDINKNPLYGGRDIKLRLQFSAPVAFNAMWAEAAGSIILKFDTKSHHVLD